MPVEMSTKTNEQELKVLNKHIKCHIVKWANDIKLFWNNYLRKNALLTEERSKCSWCIVDNYSKIQKQSFLSEHLFQKLPNFNFFSIHCSGIFWGKINIDNTSENI